MRWRRRQETKILRALWKTKEVKKKGGGQKNVSNIPPIRTEETDKVLPISLVGERCERDNFASRRVGYWQEKEKTKDLLSSRRNEDTNQRVRGGERVWRKTGGERAAN